METIAFLDFIRSICKRPGMFTGGSLKETLAFIDGYRFGNSTPISGRIFEQYICIRNSFPTNYVWTYVIANCVQDENDAMRLLETVITEFVKIRETMNDEELLQYAARQVAEEDEPVKIFRQFDKALLFGLEADIRPLIEEHPDAHILWQDAYPQDIAEQLSEIAESQPIRSIPISDDGKKVRIIAAGWPFPIGMNFRDGQWRVNAENIIQLRISNQRVEQST